MDEFQSRDAQVVAVNPGSINSHAEWAAECGFDFPICEDKEKHVAATYGVLDDNGGIQRTVMIVNKKGRVTFLEQGMPSTEEILGALDAMANNDPDSTRLSSS